MHKTFEVVKLIQANTWIVMSHVLAQPEARRLLATKYEGEWKYLYKMVYDHAEVRADRALLELATQLRILDDVEDIGGWLKDTGGTPFGTVVQADQSETNMYLRDMTNKVLHAAKFEWKFGDDPIVTCWPHDSERWVQADLRIMPLFTFVGGLII